MRSLPFESPSNVLDWADEGIRELHAACGAYFHRDSFREVTEFDAESGQNIVKVVGGHKLPSGVARKATEALSNIKNCFDQTIYSAVWAVRGKRPKDSLYFPWSELGPGKVETVFRPLASDRPDRRVDGLIKAVLDVGEGFGCLPRNATGQFVAAHNLNDVLAGLRIELSHLAEAVAVKVRSTSGVEFSDAFVSPVEDITGTLEW